MRFCDGDVCWATENRAQGKLIYNFNYTVNAVACIHFNKHTRLVKNIIFTMYYNTFKKVYCKITVIVEF